MHKVYMIRAIFGDGQFRYWASDSDSGGHPYWGDIEQAEMWKTFDEANVVFQSNIVQARPTRMADGSVSALNRMIYCACALNRQLCRTHKDGSVTFDVCVVEPKSLKSHRVSASIK